MNAIVIGESHHNTLGIIRSLGIKKVFVDAIILTSKNKTFVSKSKYLKSSHIIRQPGELFNVLNLLCARRKKLYVLYSGSDLLSKTIDENKNILPKNLHIPNALNFGGISNLMNKSIGSKIAKDCGITTLEEWTIDSEMVEKFTKEILPHIDFECILKPLNSVSGTKQDIIICSTSIELEKNLKYLLTKIEAVIVQRYIKKDFESSILGVSLPSGEIIIPGIIKKIREYPFNMGSSSFSLMLPNPERYLDLKSITGFIKKLGYRGLFSIEFVVQNGIFYFLEINLRNDGNGYVPIADNVNLPYIYILDVLDKTHVGEKKKISKEIYFMIEINDFKYMINKPMNPSTWFSSIKKSSCFLLWNRNDIKPFIYKFIYG